MDRVKKTFDNWALIGRTDLMEKEHRKPVLKVLNSIKFSKKFSFLDVGCGNGWIVRKILENKNCKIAVGIDISSNMVRLARSLTKSPKTIFIKTDLEKWNTRQKFDYIFSMESIYYVNSLEKSLNRIFKLLNPNGVFYCGTDFYKENNATSNWAKKMNMKMHLLSKKEWLDVFEEAGFKVRMKQVKDKSSSKKWKREFGTLFIIATKKKN